MTDKMKKSRIAELTKFLPGAKELQQNIQIELGLVKQDTGRANDASPSAPLLSSNQDINYNKRHVMEKDEDGEF